MVSRVNIVGYDCGVEYDPDGYYVKYADYAALEARLAEMTRRRDEWRKKAEGYDDVRRALREKVGTPWPPHMSRLLWAGIAADEKKRADDAEARLAEARKALNYLNDAVAVGLPDQEISRRAQLLVSARRTREQGGENNG